MTLQQIISEVKEAQARFKERPNDWYETYDDKVASVLALAAEQMYAALRSVQEIDHPYSTEATVQPRAAVIARECLAAVDALGEEQK